ncbi:MAG: acyl-CoA dehydrogenase family protein [Microvirga sp.]
MPGVRSLQQRCGSDGLLAAANESARQAARPEDPESADAPLTEAVASLRRSGLLAAPLPRRLGGAGLGLPPEADRRLCSILRLLGSGSLALGRHYEHHVSALRLIAAHGTAEQVARMVEDARTGHLFGFWYLDDDRAPLQAASGVTEGTVVEGSLGASGPAVVDRPLVAICLSSGEIALISPWLLGRHRSEGAGATARVDLPEVALRAHDLVAVLPADSLEAALSGVVWSAAAVHLGRIESILDDLRDHHRAAGHDHDPRGLARLGEAAMAVETARLMVERAASQAQARDEAGRQASSSASLAGLAVGKAGECLLDIAHGAGRPSDGRPDGILERLSRQIEEARLPWTGDRLSRPQSCAALDRLHQAPPPA